MVILPQKILYAAAKIVFNKTFTIFGSGGSAQRKPQAVRMGRNGAFSEREFVLGVIEGDGRAGGCGQEPSRPCEAGSGDGNAQPQNEGMMSFSPPDR